LQDQIAKYEIDITTSFGCSWIVSSSVLFLLDHREHFERRKDFDRQRSDHRGKP
jgi:hypothetical protein